jgi:hypothetical protein
MTAVIPRRAGACHTPEQGIETNAGRRGRARMQRFRMARGPGRRNSNMKHTLLTAILIAAAAAATPAPASAHCDTLNGPVVQAARLALKAGDVAPVLKWVQPGLEAEVRSAFSRALEVRSGGPAARDLADIWFFETVVRLHRAGEGEPFTGLKPAAADPALEAADHALEAGSAEDLQKLVSAHVIEGLRARFARTLEARGHADHNLEAGRAYVAAYVDYVHYVESLHSAGTGEHAATAGAAAHSHEKK